MDAKSAEFRPGFRFSRWDALVLGLGILALLWAWPAAPWLSFIIAFVAGHFFLFCNVFRISRRLELIWAAVFLFLAGDTLKSDYDTWKGAALLSLVTTVIVIGLEIRKPFYHGIGWSRVNPGLHERWNASSREGSLPAEPEGR